VSRFRTDPVRVTVPATSANLGPGFDALGLALSLQDELRAHVTPSGLQLDVAGEGADYPRDEGNLVVRAMRAGFDRLGGQPPGLALSCRNRIPHGRGLGSSAAAIVGGLVLAREMVADGTAALPDAELLALADELEGHPDNVAPALLGGLTIAWRQDGRAAALRLECDPRVRPVVLVPPFAASTEQARGLLPASVPHGDAARNAGRAALLVAALTGHPDQLFAATDDRLHQHYRAAALGAGFELLSTLRSAGLPAVVSGAGPTLLVLARTEDEAARSRACAPPGWTVPEVTVAARGAHAVPA
jgi:homoserine kinase